MIKSNFSSYVGLLKLNYRGLVSNFPIFWILNFNQILIKQKSLSLKQIELRGMIEEG